MHVFRFSHPQKWLQEKPGKYLTVALSPLLGNAHNLTLGAVVLLPGVVSDEHTHVPGVEEIFVIISGRGRLKIGEEEEPVETGMAILGEAGKPHRLSNTGDETIRAFWLLAPPGEEKRIIDRWISTDIGSVINSFRAATPVKHRGTALGGGQAPAKPDSYLNWLVAKTRTKWWHDSCHIPELELALQHGASGITTNPLLNYKEAAVLASKDPELISRITGSVPPEQKAEAVVRHIVGRLAPYLQAEHEKSGAANGYVCAQVNPKKATDKAAMVATARFYHALASNIAVKIPVTRAGLEAMEEAVADGIPVVATVGFTVAQLVAVAEACQRGLSRARQNGIPPPPTFATMMIGRLDDYLRDIAQESSANVRKSDIEQAGLAVTKRAYELYRERGYSTKLIVAALRGNYHMVELAGAEVVMSIHPKYQALLLDPGVVREERIENPVEAESLKRLTTMKEFVRAYEPDGLAPSEFLSYGVTQRTITQFVEGGWALIEGL